MVMWDVATLEVERSTDGVGWTVIETDKVDGDGVTNDELAFVVMTTKETWFAMGTEELD